MHFNSSVNSPFEPLKAADEVGRSQDEGEGDEVAKENTGEEDVTELASSRLDDRRFIVTDEYAYHEQRHQDTCNMNIMQLSKLALKRNT